MLITLASRLKTCAESLERAALDSHLTLRVPAAFAHDREELIARYGGSKNMYNRLATIWDDIYTGWVAKASQSSRAVFRMSQHVGCRNYGQLRLKEACHGSKAFFRGKEKSQPKVDCWPFFVHEMKKYGLTVETKAFHGQSIKQSKTTQYSVLPASEWTTIEVDSKNAAKRKAAIKQGFNYYRYAMRVSSAKTALIRPCFDLTHKTTFDLIGVCPMVSELACLAFMVKGEHGKPAWENGQSMTICSGERLYSPVASMSKEDRLKLTIDGEKVVELDIKSSQPLHLAFFNKFQHRRLKNFGAEVVRTFEVDDIWKEQVLNGDIYTYIMERHICLGEPVRDKKTGKQSEGRDAAKVYMLKFLFGNAAYNARVSGRQMSKQMDALARMFPKTFKSAHGLNSRTQDYKALSEWSTLHESQTMHKVRWYLVNEGIPFATVHDAVLVPASKAKAALEIIAFVLGELIDDREKAKMLVKASKLEDGKVVKFNPM